MHNATGTTMNTQLTIEQGQNLYVSAFPLLVLCFFKSDGGLRSKEPSSVKCVETIDQFEQNGATYRTEATEQLSTLLHFRYSGSVPWIAPSYQLTFSSGNYTLFASSDNIAICCRAFTEVQVRKEGIQCLLKDTFAAFERMDTTRVVSKIASSEHLLQSTPNPLLLAVRFYKTRPGLWEFPPTDGGRSQNQFFAIACSRYRGAQPRINPASLNECVSAKMDPAGFISATSSTLCDLAKVMYWLNVVLAWFATFQLSCYFAWKMSQVAGLLNETTFGFLHETSVPRESSDENNLIPIIQAPILGSILTNLLLCLRSFMPFCCLRTFDPKYLILCPQVRDNFQPPWDIADVLRISQAISIALIVAFILHVWASGDYSDLPGAITSKSVAIFSWRPARLLPLC
ncbi:vacuolar calcium ion transporter [Colletotrichum cuscutae]|uniref:Vacuolar calcium ion transporter n=1 Tax=Colletotrichum cuscutae TaxID=1209917 RepID=A0AAJ0DNU6_9PEZI|nr:vacuolar calcium ion transporter [Colletotrichum cuscutae]